MTKPVKDEVLQSPDQAHTDGGAPSSSPQAAVKGSSEPAGGKGSAAGAGPSHKAEKAGSQNGSADQVEAEGAAAVDEALAAAQAEATEMRDKYLRLHAEWDTYRRRTTERLAEEKECATEKLVCDLLPVIDDFERSIEYAEKNGEGGLLQGVQAVHAKLVDALARQGVIVVNPKGEAFDALEAQAVSTVCDAKMPDETVADVYQKGYKMGKKVLRPAMVTVTTGGPKRETPQDD